MKGKTIFIIGFAAIMLIIIARSFFGQQSAESYAAEIAEAHRKTDLFMKESTDSPFRALGEPYQGLKYYAPNMVYRVNAVISDIDDKKIRTVVTSDGKETEYLEYGWATFKLKGVENKLLILEATEPGPNHGTLLLAFADSTSARQTYGAGRYLEIKKIPGMTSAVLDFNLAYNPYCAYGDAFSCPMPPKENVMTIGIAAGELLYH